MYHGSFRKMLKETIHESQKCQRNWDLNAQISEEDKKLIVESATNYPSKQNFQYDVLACLLFYLHNQHP